MITVMTNLIDAHVRHLRAAGLGAENTIPDREGVLRRLDRDLPMGLEQATTDELADWLAGPAKPPLWSVQTKATYYGHIVGFFRWACDERNPQLDFDPSAGLSRPRVPQGVPRPVTEDELVYALANAGEPWTIYIRLAAYAGLRAMEVAGQRREAIGPCPGGSIRIAGKGGKTRVVPTHPEVWSAVADLPPGPVAMGRRGRAHTASYVSIQVGQVMDRIGLPEVSLHRFRHRFATILLRNGVDLRTVQELMGHASPATTAIYTQITDEQRHDAIATLPALAPAPC